MPGPSYTRINYALRPAKQVERRMIFEALRRLDRISSVAHYRYVGFGSPFFIDFRLAHRELGISAMTNIEQHISDEARFVFNRPFGFVELRFGPAGDVLDTLDWAERAIVWLDFDATLSIQHLADIRRAVGLAQSGSVVLVSMNAQPLQPMDDRIARMRQDLGDYMPFDLDDPDRLGGWDTASLYRRIVTDVISEELSIRNAGAPAGATLEYGQWFNFHYSDGARMLTTGGVLFDAGLSGHVAGLAMDTLPYIRTGDAAFSINPPQLTLREMTHLDSRFPCNHVGAGLPFLTEDEVAKYQAIYRYFPRYAEVDAS